MRNRHMEKLEKLSDNLRFVMDLVCEAMDERNSDSLREESALQIADFGALRPAMQEAREIFRSIANERTDTGG